MMELYHISLEAENALRVLQRIAAVFSRNRVNIEKLQVSETECTGVSHIDITIHSEKEPLEKLVKQLGRIIELNDVHIVSKANNNSLTFWR